MKHIIIAAVILALVFIRVPAGTAQPIQASTLELTARTYLPVVQKWGRLEGTMGIWSYVEPEGAINECTNPSVETNTTGWAIDGINFSAIARVGTAQKFGVYSAEINVINAAFPGDVNAFVDTPSVTVGAGESWTFSLWYNILAANDGTYTAKVTGFAGQTPGIILTKDGEWHRYSETFVSSGAGVLFIRAFLAGGVVVGAEQFNLDAVDYVEADHLTTHIDGDQNGCEWNGTAHASTSTRSGLSRAGGVVTDFVDLNFDVTGFFGAGMAPIINNADSYALLPGGELNSVKTIVRTFNLTGWIRSDDGTLAGLHRSREALTRAIAPNSVPQDQPVIIRYTGADVDKEIAGYYDAGLEGAIRAVFECLEQQFTLRFLATDPSFYEIGNSAALLDSSDPPTLRYAAGRLRTTGQWDDLGLAANPLAGGTVYAIAVGPDGKTYIGGNFAGWGGILNRDYIARYDPVIDTWETVGGAGAINNTVRALVFGPDGTLYAGGNFLNAGAPAGDFVAQYDIATDAWSPVAGGGTGQVFALAFGLNGILYIGGAFINWNGVGASDYIVSWDGAIYAPLGTGMDGNVEDLSVHPLTGILIAAGLFTTAGGGAADGIALWNGTAWSSISSGLAGGLGVGSTVAHSADGTLYFGGSYTSVDGVAANYIALYNGQAWFPLGNGVNAQVRRVRISPSGLVYTSGLFTTAGNLSAVDRLAVWNGSSWVRADVNFPVGAIVRAIAFGLVDPVIGNNYNVWIGWDTTGVAAIAGLITATNAGTQDTFPIITIERSGAGTATIVSVRNESLGLILWFDYALLDGERLTINLNPTNKSIVSSFFRSVFSAVLPNSDFGAWHLQPAGNDVSAFVTVTGAAVIVSALQWRAAYWGVD